MSSISPYPVSDMMMRLLVTGCDVFVVVGVLLAQAAAATAAGVGEWERKGSCRDESRGNSSRPEEKKKTRTCPFASKNWTMGCGSGLEEGSR